MLLFLIFEIGHILCGTSLNTESFFIISDFDKHFIVLKRFIENHSELVYKRVTIITHLLDNKLESIDCDTEMQQELMRCTFYYKNEPIKNLLDLFLFIMDDRITGYFYESFFVEIKRFILNYFKTQEEVYDWEQQTCNFTIQQLLNCLLNFHNNELDKLYEKIHEQSELKKSEFTKNLNKLSLVQDQKDFNFFSTGLPENFCNLEIENVQQSYMNFMLPFRNPKNGLQLYVNVINSITSMLESEQKTINLFIDFHAEQFIYKYLNIIYEKKNLPNLEDCNQFLIEINKDLNIILKTPKEHVSNGKYKGSKLNLCFLRGNSKLALKHLHFAMSHFPTLDKKILRKISENLTSIEKILPQYLLFIFKGFRNSDTFFDIYVYTAEYHNFYDKIGNKKCKRYDDEILHVEFTEDFEIRFHKTEEIQPDSTCSLSNLIPNFEKVILVDSAQSDPESKNIEKTN